ncbi:GPI mannosyltransferase I [Babesia ovata]|uniref:GPI mannosyltransferase 1 n=1 Tax=Babesia ovata TaxID=189622 RepID=A0A2H6KG13_9APIC|nr:GPI mannosyltransferase I [Babesia ovata]GBE61931.1 GPI mannosyltransferase I [Babesia ovata]
MDDALRKLLTGPESNPFGQILVGILSCRWLVYILAVVLRIGLIGYSWYHDWVFEVKFTDVDYRVFTDAARLLLNGQSPYLRHTYRYTPLLALFMLPNVFFCSLCGKLFFAIFDILTAYMLEKCATAGNSLVPSIWLFNPFVVVISSRGNADCVICFLVVAALYYMKQESIIKSAVFFGLAVHFKLYPIIYLMPFILHLSHSSAARPSLTGNWLSKSFRAVKNGLNLNQLKFAAVSFAVFLSTSLVCYYFCGFDFVYETYLYHYIRKDHRHNFSVYFNYMYHMVDSGSELNPVLSFIPQMVCVFVYGLLGFWDLELSMFLQTVSFVALNKVVTCQYYLWWMCLLPLVLSKLSFERKAVMVQGAAVASFVGSNILWLFFAYSLEMLGYNTYAMLLFSSVFFVGSQMAIGWAFLETKAPEGVKKEEA